MPASSRASACCRCSPVWSACCCCLARSPPRGCARGADRSARAIRRCVNHTDAPILPTRGWTTVDNRRRPLMLYYNVGAAEMPRSHGGGAYRHEVVPIEHQTWLAPRAVCAGDTVCIVVRTFPRDDRAGGTSASILGDAIRPFERQ